MNYQDKDHHPKYHLHTPLSLSWCIDLRFGYVPFLSATSLLPGPLAHSPYFTNVLDDYHIALL